MDAAGGIEILCSALQPKELWIESGRWSKYGPELMRFLIVMKENFVWDQRMRRYLLLLHVI